MPDPAPPPGRSRVHAGLRAQILAGRFAPGSRLSPPALAVEHGAGVSAVRAALTRLAEQGLVQEEPRHGFSIVRLDLDEVRDLARARVLIEGAALREAVEHGDVEYEATIMAAHHRLARTPIHGHGTAGATDEWSAAHDTFHAALVSASPSARLRYLAQSLRDMAELYRRWSTAFAAELARDPAVDHRELLDAALDHDADRALAVMTEHIGATTDVLARCATATSGDHADGDIDAPTPTRGRRARPDS